MATGRATPLARPREVEPKRSVYVEALRALTAAEVPFLVGGAYALFDYLGRWRATKDMDLFVAPGAVEAALGTLARAGFQCEVTDAAWLAKAHKRGVLIDVIFCSYNGLFEVDQRWFKNARAARLFGLPVRVVGPEELIVSKAFVAARDRFDGADISWLIRARGASLDWARIEELMGEHWQVLLWQLVHFLYVFPAERQVIPLGLMARLLRRLGGELQRGRGAARCRGPMLDPVLYDALFRGADVDPRPRRELVAVG
jgi:hypothetical protein